MSMHSECLCYSGIELRGCDTCTLILPLHASHHECSSKQRKKKCVNTTLFYLGCEHHIILFLSYTRNKTTWKPVEPSLVQNDAASIIWRTFSTMCEAQRACLPHCVNIFWWNFMGSLQSFSCLTKELVQLLVYWFILACVSNDEEVKSLFCLSSSTS